jgi:hypothetical protein
MRGRVAGGPAKPEWTPPDRVTGGAVGKVGPMLELLGSGTGAFEDDVEPFSW